MSAERLSIAIINFNTRDDLLSCLAAARADAPLAEILVCDNGSRDGSIEALRDRDVRLLASRRNRGYAAAANAALRRTDREYLLLLNPDTTLRPGACDALLSFMDGHPEVGAAGPLLLDPDGSVQFSRRSFPDHRTAIAHRQSALTRWFPGNRLSRAYLRTDLAPDRPATVDWVSGAAILLRRTALDAAGPFDEGFFLYLEDVELCWRLQQAGWRVAWVPDAAAVHRIGASSRLVPRLALLARHRSMWRWYARHMRRSPLVDAATLIGLGMRLLWKTIHLCDRVRPP